MNLVTDHGTVIFQTRAGSKLKALFGSARVALEADGVNPDSGIAWSVVIRGTA
ncbi:pyridoxamine 5'-phosphate oxidase family protein [Arthrobacter sp. JZ12]|uniref:pyridoxamine 5'-phosphate oxidase family protein n=1 Tax=Arthrobacter sp. JZ12 TaxID=2654190 RepID=UPI002B45FCC7|nr:pyridoxamine 5'-phosphate oxidase family protein [Arthrobacter sp. JZ12]